MSHITIAASANAFVQLFNAVRDNFHFSKSDSGTFGPFSASYAIAVHLENGSLALNDDNTIEVKHVEIVWDTLKVEVCFNLPGFSIPSFCIVPDPWNGCLVGFPGISIGGPICAPLDLSGLVSEVSDLKARLVPDLLRRSGAAALMVGPRRRVQRPSEQVAHLHRSGAAYMSTPSTFRRPLRTFSRTWSRTPSTTCSRPGCPAGRKT